MQFGLLLNPQLPCLILPGVGLQAGTTVSRLQAYITVSNFLCSLTWISLMDKDTEQLVLFCSSSEIGLTMYGNPPASASMVLRLQIYTTMLSH